MASLRDRSKESSIPPIENAKAAAKNQAVFPRHAALQEVIVAAWVEAPEKATLGLHEFCTQFNYFLEISLRRLHNHIFVLSTNCHLHALYGIVNVSIAVMVPSQKEAF